MRTVFADTGYWIALLDSQDEQHKIAQDVTEEVRLIHIVTSQLVLVEFLDSMTRRLRHLRNRALAVVRNLVKRVDVEIVPFTSAQFEDTLELYSSRLDKDWSLTDCVSFSIMKKMSIVEALAHDIDFEQAGFIALLRPSNSAS